MLNRRILPIILLLSMVFSGPCGCSDSGDNGSGRVAEEVPGEMPTCNNDGICEGGENSADCPNDCPVSSDSDAPSIPQNMAATTAGPFRIDLVWDASTDNVAVAGYVVFRDGVEVGTTAGLGYSDDGLSETNKRHGYTIVAFDVEGNESAHSPMVNATTQTTGRGIWFWKGATNNPAWGTLQVVGDGEKEDAAIADFAANDIKRVYGSYGNRVATEPAVIAAWNAKLYAAGMESQALLANVVHATSDSVLVSETARRNFLEDIDDIAEFNNHPDRLDSEKFKAIHLDIEPQVLDEEWDYGSAEDKRDLLIRLEDLLADIRSRLDAAVTGLKLYADLGHYFEKLPPNLGGTGQVGWLSQEDRDQWLYDLASVLDNMSIMAYGTDNINSLNSITSTERVYFAEAEIGLNVKEIEPVTEAYGFSSVVWDDFGGFNQTMDQVEDSQGPLGNITAIHSYRYLKFLLLN